MHDTTKPAPPKPAVAAKTATKKAKADESAETRFRRLANQRFAGARKRLRQIGQLASTRYAFTATEVDKIDALLTAELEKAMGALRAHLDRGRKAEDEVALF